MPPSPSANGFAGRDAVSPLAVPAERVYADDGAERRIRILPMIARIVPAAPIAEPDVEQPVIIRP